MRRRRGEAEVRREAQLGEELCDRGAQGAQRAGVARGGGEEQKGDEGAVEGETGGGMLVGRVGEGGDVGGG